MKIRILTLALSALLALSACATKPRSAMTEAELQRDDERRDALISAGLTLLGGGSQRQPPPLIIQEGLSANTPVYNLKVSPAGVKVACVGAAPVIWVDGYYRGGYYVNAHWRTIPDASLANNLGCR
jgi:hypothetical protein